MGNFFNNESMTMKLHILNVLYGLESHAKDGRCGLSRNGDIRRFIGKLIEKQTLICSHEQGAISAAVNRVYFDPRRLEISKCQLSTC